MGREVDDERLDPITTTPAHLALHRGEKKWWGWGGKEGF